MMIFSLEFHGKDQLELLVILFECGLLVFGTHLEHPLENVLADNNGLDKDDGEESTQNGQQHPFVHAHLEIEEIIGVFKVELPK